jgi:hypothetical protein
MSPRQSTSTISVTGRSVRFSFNVGVAGTMFTLGKFFLGTATDLGGIHSPGGTHVPSKNRLEIPLPSGAVVMVGLGDDTATWSMPWRAASSAVRTAWINAGLKSGSFGLIDYEGHLYEVILKDGSIVQAKGFGNTWDLDINLQRLP